MRFLDLRFEHRPGISERADEPLLVDSILSTVASSAVVEYVESDSLVRAHTSVVECSSEGLPHQLVVSLYHLYQLIF